MTKTSILRATDSSIISPRPTTSPAILSDDSLVLCPISKPIYIRGFERQVNRNNLGSSLSRGDLIFWGMLPSS